MFSVFIVFSKLVQPRNVDWKWVGEGLLSTWGQEASPGPWRRYWSGEGRGGWDPGLLRPCQPCSVSGERGAASEEPRGAGHSPPGTGRRWGRGGQACEAGAHRGPPSPSLARASGHGKGPPAQTTAHSSRVAQPGRPSPGCGEPATWPHAAACEVRARGQAGRSMPGGGLARHRCPSVSPAALLGPQDAMSVPIICDFGSGSSKVGFAGAKMPLAIFPTVLGKFRHLEDVSDSRRPAGCWVLGAGPSLPQGWPVEPSEQVGPRSAGGARGTKARPAPHAVCFSRSVA